jgi:RNA polymerase sigma-70 factor (ECF subfamily)
VAVGNPVEQALGYKELNHQIELAIDTLPARCREVFLLSRMHYLSYAQIAQKLQISPNTVETQIVKALKVLREKLKDFLWIGIPFIFLLSPLSFLPLNMLN